MAPRPACDRHPNLQMIRCSASGYECPVPGCDRYCDDNGYFDIEVKSGTKRWHADSSSPGPRGNHGCDSGLGTVDPAR